MSRRGGRGADRWDETEEVPITLGNGERVFRSVSVEWHPKPIEAMAETQLWWIIATEELFEGDVITWSQEMFGQTSLLIADGWQWVDKAVQRPKPYWRTV